MANRHHTAHHEHHEHDEHHEHVVVDRHDTDVDNSVHQNIDTGEQDGHDWHDREGWDDRDWDGWRHHGGDFHQIIDNDPVVASGHGAVAARGDLWDTAITSGDGDVVGSGTSAVTDDAGTTAFGTGATTVADVHHASVGDGGAVSFGGQAFADDTDTDTRAAAHNSGSGSTAVNVAGGYGNASQYADQHETDGSVHSHYADETHTDSHLEYNAHNSSEFSDSHDVDVHHY